MIRPIKQSARVLLLISCLLLFSVMVMAVLQLDSYTNTLAGDQGTTVSGNFTLSNPNGPLNYTTITYASTDLVGSLRTLPSSIVTFNPQNLDLIAVNETRDVLFFVAIPQHTFADVYRATINGSSPTEPLRNISFVYNLTVNSEPGLDVVVPTSQLLQGEHLSLRIILNNTGNTDHGDVTYNLTNFTRAGEILPVTGAMQGSVDIPYDDEETLILGLDALQNQTTGVYTSTLQVAYVGGTLTQEISVTVVTSTESIVLQKYPTNLTFIRGLVNTETMTLTFINNGTVDVPVMNVSVTDLGKGNDKIVVSPRTFTIQNLDAGENQSKVISLTLQSGVETGTFTGNITYTTDTNTYQDSLNATVRNPVGSVSFSSLDFGEVDRGENVTKTVTITNTGDLDMSNLIMSSTAGGSYKVNVAPTTIPSLPKGAQADVSVNLTIPTNEDSGQHTIGKFKVTSDQVNASSDMSINPISRLKIKRVDVDVEGNTENSLDEGDVIDEVLPEDTVRIEVTIENDYSTRDEEDFDIDNIEVELVAENMDDGDDDYEKNFDDISLDAKEKEGVTFSFDVPNEIDDGEHDVTITVTGTDDRGAEHQDTLRFTLNVEREDHQIIIRSAELSDDVLSCERTAELSVHIQNVGTNDEDEVVVEISNNLLGIRMTDYLEDELISDIDDEDSEYENTYTIAVDDDVAVGQYHLLVEVFYDEEEYSDSEVVSFTVASCSGEEEKEPEEPEEPVKHNETQIDVVYQPRQPITPPSGVTVAEPTTTFITESFFESSAYYAFLIVMNTVLLIVVIVLLVRVTTRK